MLRLALDAGDVRLLWRRLRILSSASPLLLLRSLPGVEDPTAAAPGDGKTDALCAALVAKGVDLPEVLRPERFLKIRGRQVHP